MKGIMLLRNQFNECQKDTILVESSNGSNCLKIRNQAVLNKILAIGELVLDNNQSLTFSCEKDSSAQGSQGLHSNSPNGFMPEGLVFFDKGIFTSETLLDELMDQGFTRVRPLFGQQTSDKMNVDGFILTPSLDLPEFICILGMEKKVKTYIPRVMICNHCQRHGHTAKVCRSKPRCSRCANNHLTSSCIIKRDNITLFKCPNCLGNHHAKDKACPVTKNVEKVIVKAVQEKITIGAAKKKYADILKSNMQLNDTTPALSNEEFPPIPSPENPTPSPFMSTQQTVLEPLIKKIIDDILTVRIPEMISSFLSSKFKQIEDSISGRLEKMFQDFSSSHAPSDRTFKDLTSNHSISEDDLESLDSVLISTSPVKPTSEISKKPSPAKNQFLKRNASALSPISKQKATKNKRKQSLISKTANSLE